MKTWIKLTCLALFAVAAFAQVGPRRPYVRASGTGIVSIKPDQLQVTVNVITSADTASAAADANASQTTTVIGKLKELLGANADLQTVGYSVVPNYRYPQGGGTPTLTGFTATNSIRATSSDLNIGGRIIDVAVSAGATTVQGIAFGLKDNTSAVSQALRLATMNARTHADAIASGLGKSIGAITVAYESSSSAPSPLTASVDRTAATPTPIESGTLQIRADVTIEAELN